MDDGTILLVFLSWTFAV